MIRLGMVGGALSYHGRYFARMYNGAEPEAWAAGGVGGEAGAGRRIDEAQIVKVFDESRQDAETLAAMCRIEAVCDEPADCARDVDALLIPDDCTCRHYRFAEGLWQTGLPMFIDKPLAGTIEEAEAVLEQARKHDVCVFSASPLQYTREIAEARPEIEKLGRILVAMTASPNELIFYGIHGLAMLWSVFGSGIESVQNVGEGGVDIVKYRWRDGQLGVHLGLEDGQPGWGVTLFGENGRLRIDTSDADAFYYNVQMRFLEMVRTGRQPLSDEQMLEIIRALCLAKASKARGTGEVIRL